MHETSLTERTLAAIGAAVSGLSVAHFWMSLVLLGVGWNFLYVGGTALLTQTYRPEERAKAQGANEFAIFLMMVISSLSSGVLVTGAGWELLNLAALLPLGAVLVAIPWLAARSCQICCHRARNRSSGNAGPNRSTRSRSHSLFGRPTKVA
jgi:MFS family permease